MKLKMKQICLRPTPNAHPKKGRKENVLFQKIMRNYEIENETDMSSIPLQMLLPKKSKERKNAPSKIMRNYEIENKTNMSPIPTKILLPK